MNGLGGLVFLPLGHFLTKLAEKFALKDSGRGRRDRFEPPRLLGVRCSVDIPLACPRNRERYTYVCRRSIFSSFGLGIPEDKTPAHPDRIVSHRPRHAMPCTSSSDLRRSFREGCSTELRFAEPAVRWRGLRRPQGGTGLERASAVAIFRLSAAMPPDEVEELQPVTAGTPLAGDETDPLSEGCSLTAERQSTPAVVPSEGKR